MTLYEMLAKTIYNQIVWIYETNDYDQNWKIFKGEVEDARADEEVWMYLMCEVEQYECTTGILLIKIKTEHFNITLEERYSDFGSERWGREKEKRPWRSSYEIYKEMAEITKIK